MTVGGRRRETLWQRPVPALYSLAVALVVVGPLLGRGYLLFRDAVSSPRSYLTDVALGLGDAAPRAVPQDALLAVVSTAVDGGVAVKVILVVALWAAGWGAAALARELLGATLGPQLVAATVALWNPYVAERLLQGHWSLLTGYAALPWTVLAARRIRRAAPGTGRTWHDRALLGGCFAAAGLTPTGALLAGVVALATAGRRAVGVLVLWCVAALPWLAATVLAGTGSDTSDPAGVAAFAARAEPRLGTLGSLAGLGGIWNSAAVPGSRTTLFALVATVVLLAMVGAGVWRVATGGDRDTVRDRRTLLILAAVAVVLPALGATGWGITAGEFLVEHVPGTGLLRDTQKYVALAMPAYALCAASGCRLLAALGGAAARGANELPSSQPAPDPEPGDGLLGTPLAATLFVFLLLATLPDLAWGAGGELRPVRYPPGWAHVAAHIESPGDVAVLPGGMFRKFPFSGEVAVLDPAPRLLPRDVLQTGELPVRGRVVAGEGSRARAVEQSLLRGDPATRLADRGVGWVLVERTSPGPLGESATTLAQLDSVYTDDDLALYRVPGPITEAATPTAAARIGTVAAHLIWVLLLLGGAAAAVVAAIRSRRA
ncbi:hypothetical protein [Nocardia sp. alder85J]|uniref:hypothetical protein n=1 Tax=Nocardia sp. alder85J TaxID=2862949 RepID=UPI001CD4FFAB|nr:hypothetical protein [Nocardia sp. alder85J]MCX4096318.1 hypothetical protein [Nocardia sp. alder85J]